MLLAFEEAPRATSMALAAQRLARDARLDRTSEAAGSLRMGVHCADIVLDDIDIYGSGVNLAARLAGLAGPGEIVVSVEVRDQLLAGVDADIEDLGDCYLKHLDAPVRAFRVAAPGVVDPSAERVSSPVDDLRPTIVVLPLRPLVADAEVAVLSEIVADDLIGALARSAQWNVVSRLSSSARAAQGADLTELRRLFNASHVLSGHFRCHAGRARCTFELAETRDGRVVWSRVADCSLAALFAGECKALDDIVGDVSTAVLSRDMDRAGTLALPSLEGYAVLMQGINLMHRMSLHDSARASQALQHVVDRHPRAPEPRAWLGKWYVMRVAQAWTTDPRVEAAHARSVVARALDMAPNHSLSLAIDGLVHAMVERDLPTAQRRYEQALACNPNEAHAWLFLSSVYAHRGDGRQARACMARARAVSPLDPLDYFYDGFDAWAALAAGDYADAERLALRSYRANRCHLPTYTALTAAHALAGHADEARQAGQRMLALRPAFSVDRFVAQFPGGPNAHAQRLADALRSASLPA